MCENQEMQFIYQNDFSIHKDNVWIADEWMERADGEKENYWIFNWT